MNRHCRIVDNQDRHEIDVTRTEKRGLETFLIMLNWQKRGVQITIYGTKAFITAGALLCATGSTIRLARPSGDSASEEHEGA